MIRVSGGQVPPLAWRLTHADADVLGRARPWPLHRRAARSTKAHAKRGDLTLRLRFSRPQLRVLEPIGDQSTLCQQKVEGSSPFIRLLLKPAWQAGFVVVGGGARTGF